MMTTIRGRTLYYPALVVERFSSQSDIAARFRSHTEFTKTIDLLRPGVAVPFAVSAVAADGDAGCVLVQMPDKTYAACLYFVSDMRDTEKEATDLARELSAPGGDHEDSTVLVLSLGAPVAGRAA